MGLYDILAVEQTEDSNSLASHRQLNLQIEDPMKIHLSISIGCTAALAFFSVACTRSAPIETSSSNKIDPSHLENLIDKEENLFFLDVRTPEEVATLGTLPGYINIPIDQLEQRLGEIPKSKPIVTA